jgi:hypothetical protein
VRRRHAIRALGAAALLAACSSGGNGTATATSTSVAPAPSHTAAPTGVTTTAVSTTPRTTPIANPPPSTTASCPAGGSTAPASTTGRHASALLLMVAATTAPCADRVAFSFAVKGDGTPSCRFSYEPGPFSQDASGAPVSVAGTAFVVVHCSPAYGYDFHTGKTTYTGPKHIETPQARHVRELAETGDNEGVLSWVVGLDARRPFAVAAQTTPPGLSVVAITFS